MFTLSMGLAILKNDESADTKLIMLLSVMAMDSIYLILMFN